VKLVFNHVDFSVHLTRKSHVWGEHIGHHAYCELMRLESVHSYDKRKGGLLTFHVVFVAVKTLPTPLP
jgi:hypothetical protein